LKEILIDKSINGEPIDEHIIAIAACNPYQLKGEFSSASAGLNFYENIEGIK